MCKHFDEPLRDVGRVGCADQYRELMAFGGHSLSLCGVVLGFCKEICAPFTKIKEKNSAFFP